MGRQLRLIPAGVEEAQFKRIPEGWVFSTTNPWGFGRRRSYLVNEAQKIELAARVRRSRYIRLLLLIPLVLLVFAALLLVPQLRSGRLETWLWLGGLVILFTPIFGVSDYLAVRPLLRDLSRTNQKVRLADMWRTQSEAMSVRALAILTLIFVASAASQTAQALASANLGALAALGAAIFVLLGITFGAMLVHKLSPKPVLLSTEMTVEQLTTQLHGMERAWRFVGFSLVGLIVSTGLAAAVIGYLLDQTLTLRHALLNRFDEASVQALTLRNDQGDRAARLHVNAEGSPSVQLYDKQKKIRAAIGMRDNTGNPFFVLEDANGKLRWYAGLVNQGPLLALSDANDQTRLAAGVNDRGPYLTLSDSAGKVRWSIAVDEAGARVKTFDASGKEMSASP